MLTEERARSIVDAALAATTADDLTVELTGGTRTHLRWANNAVTTSGVDRDHRMAVTATFGTASGTAEVNQLDPEGIAEAVRRAEALARVAPEDPEHVPSLGPQELPTVDAHHPSSDPDAIIDGVARATDLARAEGLISAGYVEHHDQFSCFATKNGLFAWHPSTAVNVSQTARTPDGKGSGWASLAADRPDDLDFDAMAAAAVEKAAASAGMRPIEPGRYVTILEPACVSELLALIRYNLDARRADEGRSWLSEPGGATKVDVGLFPDWLHLWSDPAEPTLTARPWGPDGLPRGREDWIRGGAVRTLSRDRFWASRTDDPAVAPPGNFVLDGGSGSLDRLIAGTERGLLVTTLWYIRQVDPRTLMHTGLTRDGVFWIEDGEIRHPVTNLRWNDSPVDVLKHAVAATEPVRIGGRKGDPRMRVPALKTSSFQFTAVSDAV